MLSHHSSVGKTLQQRLEDAIHSLETGLQGRGDSEREERACRRHTRNGGERHHCPRPRGARQMKRRQHPEDKSSWASGCQRSAGSARKKLRHPSSEKMLRRQEAK